MNFTGQIRRPRTINLGGRSTTANRESLLKKAQLDRQKRLYARQQEQAALTIQSYYRAYLQVAKARLQVLQEWHDKYSDSTASLDINQLQCCIREITFFLPIWRRRKSTKISKSFPQLSQISRHIYSLVSQNIHLLSALASHTNPYLYNKFVCTLSDLGSNHDILSILAQCYSYARPRSQIAIVLYVAQYLEQVEDDSRLADFASLFSALSHDHPDQTIAYILRIPHLFDKCGKDYFLPLLKADHEATSSAVSPLSPAPSSSSASPEDSLWTLANLIYLISSSELSPHAIFVLSSTLASIKCSIRYRGAHPDDDDGYDDEEDEEQDNNGHHTDNNIDNKISKKPAPFIFLDPGSFLDSQISKIYTRPFVSKVFSLYKGHTDGGENADTASSISVNTLASLYIYLIHLWPDKRKDLMLYLSLSFDVSVVHIFWSSFQQSECYSTILRSAPTAATMIQLGRDFPDDWTKFVLVLQLYSYWLIIADDTEFVSNTVQGLSLDQVADLSKVLKHLCYSLIWWWSTINDKLSSTARSSSAAAPDSSSSKAAVLSLFKNLKSQAILVIRQIYIRDSRRPFLPRNFWLMTNTIDMEQFIPDVVAQEELDSNRSVSDDEDAQHTSSSPFSSSSLSRQQSRRPTGSARQSIVAPRLEILRKVPFFMPFNLRVHIFQSFIDLDKAVNRDVSPYALQDILFGGGSMAKYKGQVRREFLLQDAYAEFGSKGSSQSPFKHSIGVTFLSNGVEEAGIDGGGLTKEFLTSVCKEGFDPSKKGLFCTTNNHLLYPNPIYGIANPAKTALTPEELKAGLNYIEFLGEVIGKCLYDGTLVDVEFAPFFLQKWAGRASKNSFDDLYSLDPEIYKNLVQLRNYSESDVESLGLTFSITQVVGKHNEQQSIELVPGGEDIAVTNANRLEYIHAIANYKLNTALARQTMAFLTGMSKVISLQWLSMFNAAELQMLISGGNAQIDLEDLAHNTVYGGYGPSSPTILAFWEVLAEMDQDDRRDLVKFVTSVPKAPLLGFSQLNPKFAIHNGGPDIDRLPTSSTCVNLLKLPDYKDKHLLKEKILYSIHSGAGFDLS